MEFYEKSPLRGLSNFLLISQFGFTVFLIVKGSYTAYFNGSGIFESIFIGGFLANYVWLVVPGALFAMYWLWPRLLIDLVNIVVLPICMMLMLSIGWNLSGTVPESSWIYRDDRAQIYADYLQDTYTKYKQGDADAKIEVEQYERANKRSFQKLIDEAYADSLKDKQKQKEDREKANWGVRILTDLLN